MRFQDNFGNEVMDLSNVPDDLITIYLLNAELQEIGDLLNIKGKFKLNYGTDTIKEEITKIIVDN